LQTESEDDVTDVPPGGARVAANGEQIKLLFDYTKFHIGMYSTFATAVLALLAGEFADDWSICEPLLAWSLLPIGFAGIAGGVIASSLPHLYGSGDIREADIGPLWFEKWKLKGWTYVEHSAFWIAVLMAAAALAIPVIFDCCERTAKGKEPIHVIIDSVKQPVASAATST
jgi:hypothetical protein